MKTKQQKIAEMLSDLMINPNVEKASYKYANKYSEEFIDFLYFEIFHRYYAISTSELIYDALRFNHSSMKERLNLAKICNNFYSALKNIADI